MFIKIKLKKYINENLKEKHSNKKLIEKFECYDEDCQVETNMAGACFKSVAIDSFINQNKENTFQKKLFEIIDKKNLKDSDVYNKVNIDRRLFSKIRGNKDYHPSNDTVILLAIALELNEEELEDLLNQASYSLPKNNTFDLIIRFCFKEKIYNINKINEFLYDYNCKTLNKGE